MKEKEEKKEEKKEKKLISEEEAEKVTGGWRTGSDGDDPNS